MQQSQNVTPMLPNMDHCFVDHAPDMIDMLTCCLFAHRYSPMDLISLVLLLTMFILVTYRKLLAMPHASFVSAHTATAHPGSTDTGSEVAGPHTVVPHVMAYNVVMLWVVAATVMGPYLLLLVSRRLYLRIREQLFVVSGGAMRMYEYRQCW